MGLGFMKTCKGMSRWKSPIDPDPLHFKVEWAKTSGDFTLAEVIYSNCTNWSGRKILLLAGINAAKLIKLKQLDPHFQEEIITDTSLMSYKVLARFEPSPTGIGIAEKLFSLLTQNKNK